MNVIVKKNINDNEGVVSGISFQKFGDLVSLVDWIMGITKSSKLTSMKYIKDIVFDNVEMRQLITIHGTDTEYYTTPIGIWKFINELHHKKYQTVIKKFNDDASNILHKHMGASSTVLIDEATKFIDFVSDSAFPACYRFILYVSLHYYSTMDSTLIRDIIFAYHKLDKGVKFIADRCDDINLVLKHILLKHNQIFCMDPANLMYLTVHSNRPTLISIFKSICRDMKKNMFDRKPSYDKCPICYEDKYLIGPMLMHFMDTNCRCKQLVCEDCYSQIVQDSQRCPFCREDIYYWFCHELI